MFGERAEGQRAEWSLLGGFENHHAQRRRRLFVSPFRREIPGGHRGDDPDGLAEDEQARVTVVRGDDLAVGRRASSENHSTNEAAWDIPPSAARACPARHRFWPGRRAPDDEAVPKAEHGGARGGGHGRPGGKAAAASAMAAWVSAALRSGTRGELLVAGLDREGVARSPRRANGR